MTNSTSASGPSRKRNAVASSTAADKATVSLKKARKRAGEAADEAAEDERVDIVLDEPARLAAASTAPTISTQGNKRRKDPGNEEAEDELLPSRPAMFKQRDLVAEAFAGDDVVADFAKDKARQIAADAPKEENTTLAGWVSRIGDEIQYQGENASGQGAWSRGEI